MTSGKNKKIAKNTLFLYFRSILLLIINLYTSRVTLQMLGVEDFGVYALVAGVVEMFSMLGSTLASSTQRFITYALGENDEEKLKTVFCNSLTLHIIMGIVVCVLLEVVGIYFIYYKLSIPSTRLMASCVVLQTAIVSFFFNMISVPYNGLINAHERMKAFAYISIIEGCMKLGAAALLVFVSFDHLIFYSFLILLSNVALRLLYTSYSKRNFDEARNFKFSIDTVLLKKMFAFAGWNLWGEGSMVLRNQGIDILINTFFGVSFNAAKGISNQIHRAIYGFVSNFQAAVRPQLTMSVAQNNYRRTKQLIFQGSRFSFYLMSLFIVPLYISVNDVLELWLANVPPYAAELTRWTLIFILLDTLSRFSIHAINATGNIRNYQITVGGLKMCALPIAYFVLKLGGSPVTGLIVNVAIEVVCLFLRLYFNKKQIGMDVCLYMKDVVARCILVLIVAYTISYYLNLQSLAVFVSVPISFLSTTIVISILGVSKRERNMVYTKIKTFVAKRTND